MSTRRTLPFEKSHEVRDACLCLSVQRAARVLARHFDEAFRPWNLTNGQFSLMVALNRKHPPVMGEVAALLAMDRTTLTAALKSLQRRGLVEARADDEDKRSRRLLLTPAGRLLLAEAHGAWKTAHAEIEARLGAGTPERLRGELMRLAADEQRGRQTTRPL
jgi:DNA-binding MarR family transcriptional regulator